MHRVIDHLLHKYHSHKYSNFIALICQAHFIKFVLGSTASLLPGLLYKHHEPGHIQKDNFTLTLAYFFE